MFFEIELEVMLHIIETGSALEGFQFLFRTAQFLREDNQAFVNELFGAQGYLVFIVVGIAVISDEEFIEKIDAATAVGVTEREFCHRSGFGSGRHTERCRVHIGHIESGSYYHMQVGGFCYLAGRRIPR